MTSNILSILQAVYAPVPIELIFQLSLATLVWAGLIAIIEAIRSAMRFIIRGEN